MIYLNGKWMPIEEACVPVLDRGFIFGDGVYEVIPAYSRKPFRLNRHLNRLQHSLDGIRLKNPFSNEEWKQLLEQVIASNEGEDQYLYLHITRGVAKRDHAFPLNVAPTVFIMSNPLLPPPAELLVSEERIRPTDSFEEGREFKLLKRQQPDECRRGDGSADWTDPVESEPTVPCSTRRQ